MSTRPYVIWPSDLDPKEALSYPRYVVQRRAKNCDSSGIVRTEVRPLTPQEEKLYGSPSGPLTGGSRVHLIGTSPGLWEIVAKLPRQ